MKTTRPVTQTAEVDVNRALSGDVKFPELLEKGMAKRIVPRIIDTAKPYARIIIVDKGLVGLGMTRCNRGEMMPGVRNTIPSAVISLCSTTGNRVFSDILLLPYILQDWPMYY